MCRNWEREIREREGGSNFGREKKKRGLNFFEGKK